MRSLTLYGRPIGDDVEIRREPYGSPLVRPLTDALEAELTGRYEGQPGSGGEPPSRDFDPPEGSFLVVELDGVAVGCGGICRFDDSTAELRRMYVAPEARGRGLSRALLAALEREAGGLGYRAVRLETGVLQPEAIGLYTSAGFEAIPCYGPYVDDPRSRCFEKLLTNTNTRRAP
jgi:GNAT superfamily N-acetyltransferase